VDAGERALSAAFPGAVRDDILEGRWEPPITDGSGRDRTMAQHALALLGEAGYAIKHGVLVERTSSRPFAFEILVQSRTQERLSRICADSLRRIGMYATARRVDEVQYERRRQKFDFDMLIAARIASPSPGYGQRILWGSQSADQKASYNLAGAVAEAA
jgi:peptide/nickel transport system substrate-binding protein